MRRKEQKKEEVGECVGGWVQRERERERDVMNLIHVPFDEVDVGADGLEVLIHLLGAQVASAQDVLDLSRDLRNNNNNNDNTLRRERRERERESHTHKPAFP